MDRYKKKIIGSKEIKNVNDCLKSNWISYTGKYVKAFEKRFESYLGGGNAISTSNGTASLILALNTYDIKKDDEVIIPNFGFAAAINATLAVGAKPVVVDINYENWLIDINKIKKKISKKTKAIIVVHSYGIVFDIKKLNFLKKRNNKIFIIEDAAEALGSKINNKKVGLAGDCSTFSFYPNKNITTGEGGMLVFKEKKFFKKAKIIRNQGRDPKDKFFNHIYIGNNFRLSNINAAIGLAQLKRFSELQNERKKIFKLYDNILSKNMYLFEKIPDLNNSKNSLWLYTIKIKGINFNQRNKIVKNLIKKNIQVRPGFLPLHRQPAYKKYCKDNYDSSNEISDKIISLPTEPYISNKKIFKICKYFLKEISQILKK